MKTELRNNLDIRMGIKHPSTLTFDPNQYTNRESMGMTPSELQRYWRGFISHMEAQYPDAYLHRSPSKNNRQIVPPDWFGGAMRIAAGLNWGKENSIQVDVTLNHASKEITKAWYEFLMKDERRLRSQLVSNSDEKWRPDVRLENPESWIVLKRHSYPEERNWNEQYQWLAEKVDIFHRVIGPLINAMPDVESHSQAAG